VKSAHDPAIELFIDYTDEAAGLLLSRAGDRASDQSRPEVARLAGRAAPLPSNPEVLASCSLPHRYPSGLYLRPEAQLNCFLS
jgi:hypothetical protein